VENFNLLYYLLRQAVTIRYQCPPEKGRYRRRKWSKTSRQGFLQQRSAPPLWPFHPDLLIINYLTTFSYGMWKLWYW
jgi:hypothetical protein